MTEVFRAAIARALPSRERLRESLLHLSARDLQDAADYFSAVLPDFDVAVALPGAEALAQAVMALRGTFLVQAARTAAGHWGVGSPDLGMIDQELARSRRPASAVIFTSQLEGGLDELEVCLSLAHRGWQVEALAAAVARTDDLGRARIELQGIRVFTPVMLADTPGGLVFERRYPQPA